MQWILVSVTKEVMFLLTLSVHTYIHTHIHTMYVLHTYIHTYNTYIHSTHTNNRLVYQCIKIFFPATICRLWNSLGKFLNEICDLQYCIKAILRAFIDKLIRSNMKSVCMLIFFVVGDAFAKFAKILLY